MIRLWSNLLLRVSELNGPHPRSLTTRITRNASRCCRRLRTQIWITWDALRGTTRFRAAQVISDPTLSDFSPTPRPNRAPNLALTLLRLFVSRAPCRGYSPLNTVNNCKAPLHLNKTGKHLL